MWFVWGCKLSECYQANSQIFIESIFCIESSSKDEERPSKNEEGTRESISKLIDASLCQFSLKCIFKDVL